MPGLKTSSDALSNSSGFSACLQSGIDNSFQKISHENSFAALSGGSSFINENSNDFFQSQMSSPDDKKQQLDFSLIRDLQKYSQSSQDRFFADHDMCFLYLWFINSD